MSVQSRIEALFSGIKSLFEDMKALSTNQGVLYYEDDLSVGSVLFVAPGEKAPQGDYITDSNLIVVDENGVVVEIKDKPIEAAPVAEPADLACINPSQKPQSLSELNPSQVPHEVKLEDITDAIAPILSTIEELTSRVIALESRLNEISGQPSSEDFTKSRISTNSTSGIDVNVLKDALR